MARPEEKAQAMLNKWTKMREQGDDFYEKEQRKKRPFLSSHCEHLSDAEKWRREIVKEISGGVRKIQNAGLGEHAIRDLNDAINKLWREKYHWNRRIKELGGPDYNAIERRQQMEEGDNHQFLQGSGGYRYFGAAKDLPGVQELFAKQAAKQMAKKRKRGDYYKHITPDYYGFRDEEDGVLLSLEQTQQQQIEQPPLSKHQDWCQAIQKDTDSLFPSQEVISKIILQQKKQDLLSRLL